ncbi:MAG TPA: DegQ family serine endoprotease [Candidatus Binatia bacterium]
MTRVSLRTAFSFLLVPVLLLGVSTLPGAGESALSTANAQESPKPKYFGALPDFVPLASEVGPAVVNISTTQIIKRATPRVPYSQDEPYGDFWRRFFGGAFPSQGPSRLEGLGSGFIVDREGTILTNNHVIENAEKIVVRLQDESEYDGKVLGRDPKTDVAVIKIDAKKNLPFVRLGNSDDLQVGEWVVALGSPFGLTNTMTAGIISATGRAIGAGPYDDFIQTDASINPGNSGGPLINLRGEVIGMNSAILSRSGGNSGIGFAIPINLIKTILPELKSKGKVTRGWLGITIQQVTPEIASSMGLENARGALVADVSAGGPADKAGLKVGDIIFGYDGREIQKSRELPLLVAETAIGKTVPLKVFRGKNEMTIRVTTGELNEEKTMASAATTKGLGLTVQKVTPDIAQNMGLKHPQGVVITAVDPESSAADSRLAPGDVILEIDKKPIGSLADFQEAVKGAKDKSVLLLVRRGENNIFVALKSK